MAGAAAENESNPIEDSSVLQYQSSHVLDSISHSQLPRESGDIAGPASTSLHPSGPIFIPPHEARPGTGSSTSSIPFSQVPVGSWDTFIHGSCPRCHHWHNKVTLRVSRNPGIFNGIRCEKCAHKWFGIGGNSTHTSLASQETTDTFDENDSVVRGLLLQTMRDMSAVGSPTLAIVQENPSSATSPLSRRHYSPSPATSDIQTANPPTTILQVPREGNITILDSRSNLTPSVHEAHGATQIQTKPSNNSSQGPKGNKKTFFTKTTIRNIENKLDKWRGRLKRGKRRSAKNPPAAVKPANPTPMQETRPMSPRQASSVEAQQPSLAPSNASRPEDNLPEGDPPAAIPDRTETERQESHRHTILEFRDELPRLTHKERIARLRRTLTEQQTCRQSLRLSSSAVPDNPLVDMASIYSFNAREESGPTFHDLIPIGLGPGSQNRQEDRTLNYLFIGSHFETPSYSFGESNMRHTTPVMRPPRLRNRVSTVLSSLGDRSLSGIYRSRYVDEEEIDGFQFIEEKETPPQLYRRSPSSLSPSSSQSGGIHLSIGSDSEASVQMSDEVGDSYSDERPRIIEQNVEQLPVEITNVTPEGRSTMEASNSSVPRKMTLKIGPSKSTETLLSATVEHTTAATGNSIMPNSYGAVTDSCHQEKDRNDTTGENAGEAAIVSQQLLTVDSIRPHLDKSLDTPANTTHSPIDPFCVPIESRNPPGEGRENGAEQCQPVETDPIAVIDSNVSLLESDHSIKNHRSTPQGLQLARNKGLLSTSDLPSNTLISKPHISQPPPYAEYCEVQYSESPSIKSWVLKSVKVLARPRLLLGLRRIEWTCSCGEHLYADYDNSDPSAIDNLAAALQQYGKSTQQAATTTLAPDCSQPSSNISLSEVSSTCQTTSQVSNGSQDAQYNPNDTPDSSITSQGIQHDGVRITQFPVVPLFFELCVNTSILNVNIGEIALTKYDYTNRQHVPVVQTDGELFAKIHSRYYSIRKKWWLPLLYRPVNIRFVQFHIYEGHHVGIFDDTTEPIPPPGEVHALRYHYYECPLKPLPPMDHRAFLHFFREQGKHTSAKRSLFLNRLPKKVGESMLVQDDEENLHLGWGVYIVEGLNWPVISWCMFGILLLSFIVSICYALLMKTQESGFGIGQWLVAVLTAALTALCIQLREL